MFTQATFVYTRTTGINAVITDGTVHVMRDGKAKYTARQWSQTIAKSGKFERTTRNNQVTWTRIDTATSIFDALEMDKETADIGYPEVYCDACDTPLDDCTCWWNSPQPADDKDKATAEYYAQYEADYIYG